MRVGDLQVDAVYDGVGYFDPTRYPGTTDDMWAQHQQFLTPDGKVEMALGGFLVRGASDRVILVDLGLGNAPSAVFTGGKLLESLAALGVAPEHISDVVLTHLHFDHVGWASLEGRSVFPNATYRCSIRDLEHFFGKDDRVTNVLSPVQNQIHTWQESGPIAPGIDAMVAAGHTPGSTIIVLSSGTARGLLLGDVVHCPVELIDDEWSGLADVDPDLARRTRNTLAREIEGTDTPIAAAHFPGLVFGRLLEANGRRNWLAY
jgi:glyoxylase-like metal-dependent hydrolase (beta-lactamase superfamily II)